MTQIEQIELFNFIMKPVIQKYSPNIVDKLVEMGFFDAPASTKHHYAYKGGLFEHSLNVTNALTRLTEDCRLTWSREESPLIVGMFHDICKSDQYRHPKIKDCCNEFDCGTWEYNPNCLLKGHGDKSVMLLSNLLTLTAEEVLCIRYHMGAFVDQKEWNDYTRAIRSFPNVLWTHHADMITAHIIENTGSKG